MGNKFGGKAVRTTYKAALFFVHLVMFIGFLFPMWIAMRVFAFDSFFIATASMEPTIHQGDIAIVNKALMGARLYTDFEFDGTFKDLKAFRLRGLRGVLIDDIVIFNYPFHEKSISFVLNEVYVKRCIALPGDIISINNGIYHNNNYGSVGYIPSQIRLSKMSISDIDTTVLAKKHGDPHYSWTIKNMRAIYVPRKGDIILITPKEAILYRTILEWETKKAIKLDWKHEKVYAGQKIMRRHKFLHNYYFVAGDNVLNSKDSRYYGVIPEEYIVGIVGYIAH